MTSLSRLSLLVFVTLAACVPAKSPLGDRNDDASFKVLGDRVRAVAERTGASAATFGRPKAQLLHFTVCLQSIASGQPVVDGVRFAVQDGTGHEMERAIDGGCLRWDEEHALSPNAAERNLRVERGLRALDQNHRGRRLVTFNVKPWADGEGAVQSAINQESFADAIDTRGALGFKDAYPNSAGAAAAALTVKPHFEVAGNHFELSYVENGLSSEFEIDQFLNLTLPFRYTISFQPMIARQLFSSATQTEPVTSGRLRVTLVFFASAHGDLRHDDRYLTSAQVESTVGANGYFTEQVVLKYPHLLFASGRQTMLVQITALDQPEIEPRSFVASVSFKETQGALTLLADQRNAEGIRADAERERQRRKDVRRTPFEEYLANHDVTRMNVGDLPDESQRARLSAVGEERSALLTREELTYALARPALDEEGYRFKSGWSVPAKLCHAYLPAKYRTTANARLEAFMSAGVDAYGGGDPYCSDENLAKFVRIRQLDFVESLPFKAPREVDIRTYANQDFGAYYTKDSARMNVVGIGLKSSAFGVLLGEVAQTYMTTVSKRGTFGVTQSMAIDAGAMEVYAAVRSCVVIEGVAAPFPTKPLLICDPQVRPPAWHAERFYYYAQTFGNAHSPFIDPFSAKSGVKLFIRGERRMLHQTHRLSKEDYRKSGFASFIDVPPPEMSEVDTLDRLDGLTSQDAIGAFSRY